LLPPPATIRRDGGLGAYERALHRCGFFPVAGTDEAGRGACAGPLVAAAVVLPAGPRGQVPGLADSKLLTPQARERVYGEVVQRAVAWQAVVVPPKVIDETGLHVSNVAAMRRSIAGLSVRPAYVISDGFPVPGLGIPNLAVVKGDQVVACVAAASVVAKVTRDRIMVEMHDSYPIYDFARHKGYATEAHTAALTMYGPCPEHRFSYINVAGALHGGVSQVEDNDAMASLHRGPVSR
jgi:ribonuclease HII